MKTGHIAAVLFCIPFQPLRVDHFPFLEIHSLQDEIHSLCRKTRWPVFLESESEDEEAPDESDKELWKQFQQFVIQSRIADDTDDDLPDDYNPYLFCVEEDNADENAYRARIHRRPSDRRDPCMFCACAVPDWLAPLFFPFGTYSH